jgi:hypothetical protein
MIWRQLRHPNILPFLGICTNTFPRPAMVSPYMENRNVKMYLKDFPDVDRLEIVSVSSPRFVLWC